MSKPIYRGARLTAGAVLVAVAAGGGLAAPAAAGATAPHVAPVPPVPMPPVPSPVAPVPPHAPAPATEPFPPAADIAVAERSRALRDIPARVEAALAEVRRNMSATCALKGHDVPASADFGMLALCGRDYQAEVRAALASARASIARARGMAEQERRAALSGIDRALAGLHRQPGPAL